MSIQNNTTINKVVRIPKTRWWNLEGENYDVFKDKLSIRRVEEDTNDM